MPNESGIIAGEISTRGFNDGLERGYPLLLTLSTRQVSDVVCSDEEIRKPKGGKLLSDEQTPTDEADSDRLESIRHVCRLLFGSASRGEDRLRTLGYWLRLTIHSLRV